jgi:hypothetical protein
MKEKGKNLCVRKKTFTEYDYIYSEVEQILQQQQSL